MSFFHVLVVVVASRHRKHVKIGPLPTPDFPTVLHKLRASSVLVTHEKSLIPDQIKTSIGQTPINSSMIPIVLSIELLVN